MILHRVVAKINRTVNLRPFGDLQMGEQGFRRDLWNRWKRDALADKESLLIGMGDYSDAFRGTVDHKVRHALLEDDSAYSQFDYMIMKEMQNLAEELKPFQHRIIGLHEGHHFHKMMSGVTSTQYLCQLLKVKYLDFVAGIQIILRSGHSDSKSVHIFSTHGCGGSTKIHSDLANLETKIAPYWDCDVFLRGHSTKAYVVDALPMNTFSQNRGGGGEMRVIQKDRLLVNTGGFMAAYLAGQPSNYVERANMPPVKLGWCVVNFKFNNNNDHLYLKISGQAVTE